jgi:phage recombination protein Bet
MICQHIFKGDIKLLTLNPEVIMTNENQIVNVKQQEEANDLKPVKVTENQIEKPKEKLSVIAHMAKKYGMEKQAFEAVMKNTIMPGNVTNEEFVSFLSVAKEYDLNPIVKEIYAFPSKGGGIQPIVSIDGWLKMISNHPQSDGFETKDILENGSVIAVEGIIYRKDKSHPIKVTEYMVECKRNTEPWNKWPRRMLRHKAIIQAARYAFGFSGIYDPDEVERIEEVKSPKNITPSNTESHNNTNLSDLLKEANNASSS